MDLLKAPRFPNQKRIHNKEHLSLATEILKGFSPGIFNSLGVNHNKNLEQWKFRAKEWANNISLFKSNSENYSYQLRQLTGSIPFSIFFDTSWTYGCQLRQLTWSIGFQFLDSSERYVDGRHSAFQVLGTFANYKNVNS